MAGIPSNTKRRLRAGKRAFARSQAGQRWAATLARCGGNRPRKILLVSDKKIHTSEQQFAPLIRHAGAIAWRTGFVFSYMSAEAARSLTPQGLSGYAAVGLKLSFRTPADEAEGLARHIFGAAHQSGVRAIVFDGDDDASILWPGVIEASDAYIKKHVLRDMTEYRRETVGKSNLTDYAHKTFGVEFDDDIIPSSAGLPNAQTDKIIVGWNVGLDDKIAYLAEDIPNLALQGPRPIDVLIRANAPASSWHFGLRDTPLKAVDALKERYTIHAPSDRVGQDEYYREMFQSRLCISPFGYGEICWRDFEAILSGCLLVKPDMSHISTMPDLFVPHETYVPVRWDYSDLAEACDPYISDEAKRVRVAEEARQRLLQALSTDWFAERLVLVMRQAGIGA